MEYHLLGEAVYEDPRFRRSVNKGDGLAPTRVAEDPGACTDADGNRTSRPHRGGSRDARASHARRGPPRSAPPSGARTRTAPNLRRDQRLPSPDLSTQGLQRAPPYPSRSEGLLDSLGRLRPRCSRIPVPLRPACGRDGARDKPLHQAWRTVYPRHRLRTCHRRAEAPRQPRSDPARTATMIRCSLRGFSIPGGLVDTSPARIISTHSSSSFGSSVGRSRT